MPAPIAADAPRPLPAARRLACALVALIAAALLAMAVCAAAPALALAKDYSCPQVAIAASVDEEASLHVREQRVFNFDGDFTAIWWDLGENLPLDASVSVSGVALSIDTGGDPTWMPA